MSIENLILLYANAGMDVAHINLFMLNEDETSDAVLEGWEENISIMEDDLNKLILGSVPKAKTLCLTKVLCYFNAVRNKMDVDIANEDYVTTSSYYETYSIPCVIKTMECCDLTADYWLNAFNLNFISRPDPVDPIETLLADGINYMQIEGDGITNSQFIIR
jgi:hypothetical protein